MDSNLPRTEKVGGKWGVTANGYDISLLGVIKIFQNLLC